jgi:trigger factor
MRPVLALSLPVVMLAFVGCSGDTGSDGSPSADAPSASPGAFSYSDGIDAAGLWDGITATTHVVLPDGYEAIPLAAADYEVTDEAIDSEVESLLSSYPTQSQVTDRAVADGDTVNIDYVGTVDGVAFDGGSTGGAGTDVTIGETKYIDDFLQQIIGHMPGDSFDVNVTFPEDYGVDELNGKDAVFATTLNYIAQTTTAELTDAFVAENLKDSDGWSTVIEMRDGIAATLKESAVKTACISFIDENSAVDQVPDQVRDYQVDALVAYYRSNAEAAGMEFDEFLSAYAGVDSEEALILANEEDNLANAKHSLIMQAVAEKQKITATDDDVEAYFAKYAPDYNMADVESTFGRPYIMQVVLHEKVTDFLAANAVLG